MISIQFVNKITGCPIKFLKENLKIANSECWKKIVEFYGVLHNLLERKQDFTRFYANVGTPFTAYIFAAMDPFVVWLDKEMTIGTNGSCSVEKAWRHPSFAIAWTRFQREQFVAIFAFHTVIKVMHLTFKKNLRLLLISLVCWIICFFHLCRILWGHELT